MHDLGNVDGDLSDILVLFDCPDNVCQVSSLCEAQVGCRLAESFPPPLFLVLLFIPNCCSYLR